jgi:hypothetical protein
MDSLVALRIRAAPAHPIVAGVAAYDLRKLEFTWPEGDGGAVVRMEISRHDEYVVLRFDGVTGLHVASDRPPGAFRLQIQDTSACSSGTHVIPRVRVGGVDASALQFWAQSVRRV